MSGVDMYVRQSKRDFIALASLAVCRIDALFLLEKKRANVETD